MSLSPGDVSSIIRASVLSDDAREVGGAIDAKLSLAVDRVVRRVESELTSATESLEDGVLRAVERASGRMQAATPTIEPGLSDELLQEIYRAAREEITSLRQDLHKQIRELVTTELTSLEAQRPAPLTTDQVQTIADTAAQTASQSAVEAHADALPAPFSVDQARSIAEEVAQVAAQSEAQSAVQSHADALPEPLTADAVRAIAAQLIADAKERSEADRGPGFGRDDAVAVAREVADAAVSVHAASQEAGLAEDDVHRIVTEFLLAQEPEDAPAPSTQAEAAPTASSQLAEEWGDGLPEWLQVAVLQAIGNSTGVFAPQAPAIDTEELTRLIKLELEANPPPSAAFELAGLWRDGLPSWMEAAVKAVVGEAGASSSSSVTGTSEFDEIALRQMVIEIVRDQVPLELPTAAPAAAPAASAAVAEGGPPLDEQRLRVLIRTEVADIVAELPHPPSEMELSQLIDTAVESALAEREPVAPPPAPSPAEGPAPGETGVFVSKMRLIVEQLLNEKMQDRATHAEVDKVVTRRLEASAMAEREASGGTAAGAGGGNDGLSAADVKRLVREIIEAEVPTRDEVEKMIRRFS